MYGTAGKHANVHQASKTRLFNQLSQKGKVLADIPTDLLPKHYNSAGQENAGQVKSLTTQEHRQQLQKAPLRTKVPVLGNVDSNGLKQSDIAKLPDKGKLATSESKYIVPENIHDNRSGETYRKVRYLGEGGFAICYEAENSRRQKFALKVVAKKSLRDHKTKTKFLAEINIHRSLKHPGIVKFCSCFEDSQNAYLVLELCENYTLSKMLKQRQRLTEPEARYYLIQLLDICRFLHENKVIHRDIKANNILLDYKMDAKLSDFGLAALLVNAEDRKRTICGTPNYMAPEILYGRNGHNHQADIWSIGILCYTMLIGTPPFHETSHDAIYQKIRNNHIMPSYTFPDDIRISDNAKDVITALLVNDPEKRPTIKQLLSFSFFTQDFLPAAIPVCALERPPTELDYSSNATASKSAASPDNAAAALQRATQREDVYDRKPQLPLENLELLSERLPDPRQMLKSGQSSRSNWNLSNVPGMIAEDSERHAKRTEYLDSYGVARGNVASKVLALEARQDGDVSPTKSRSIHSPTEKKQATGNSTAARLQSKPSLRSLQQLDLQARKSPSNLQETDQLLSRLRRVTPPALESPKQKANSQTGYHGRKESLDNALGMVDMLESDAEHILQCFYDVLVNTLSSKHLARSVPRSRRRSDDERTLSSVVFVDRWVDFTVKYGLGYSLSDGSDGVYFNDSTTLTTKANSTSVCYICHTPDMSTVASKPQTFTVDKYPDELRKKMTLLLHFQNYMHDKLASIANDLPACLELSSQKPVFLESYMQTERAVIFRLSNNILQINFLDHTKLVLFDDGASLIYVNSCRNWSIHSLVIKDLDKDIVSRLEYAREVLEPENRAPLISRCL
ncbi:Cell cycle serine/threonine-protein kinase cdc5/MSD2 [Umbelopsis nana]